MKCIHEERPSMSDCSNCGRELCYECSLTGQVGSRTTSFSSVDRVTELDYADFGPDCYIYMTENELFDVPQNPYSPGSSFFRLWLIITIVAGALFIPMAPLLGIGMMLFFVLMAFITSIEPKSKYKDHIEKLEKADRLRSNTQYMAPKQTTTHTPQNQLYEENQPIPENQIQSASISNFCTKCGENLKQKAKFCTACGSNIS